MTEAEFIGALVSAFGIGWFVGRGVKAVREFLNQIS